MLRLSGSLTFGQSITALHEAADQLKGHTFIVLDLTDVATVDSTGISALLDAKQTMGAASRVVLLRAPTRLQTSLDVARVADLFELVDDENGLRRALGKSHGDSAP
jgi:anti-anti-sigma factor